MSIRNLVQSGSQVLTTPTEKVDIKKFCKLDESNRLSGGKYLIARVREVADTLQSIAKGPDALAANQVGIKDCFYVALREVKTEVKENEEAQPPRYAFHEYINPEIIERSEDKTEDWEACFSYPDQVFLVERSNNITMKYQNLISGWQVEELSGLDAIIAQHEIDHLNGISVNNICSKTMTYKEFSEMEERDAEVEFLESEVIQGE